MEDTLAVMKTLQPTHVVFNGAVGALTKANALQAEVGDKVLFIHSQANRDSRPHLIGGHGDLVWPTGSFADTPLTNLETWFIRGGSAGAGFVGNCWRSPMIQGLIHERFGVFYCVHYISQLLKNMGFSYQKARFVSDHLDEEARQQWLDQKWPAILAEAKQKKALLLFGDEASFPQWGSLSYTWARKGQQPTIKTSGKRKGYKVLGLIDYFTGRFFYKCQEERFNSQTYMTYLTEVLAQTKQPIVLIQDGARYHTSKAMKAFFEDHKDRLTVYQLPSYSPDYNPIEKLWKKIK